MSENKRNRKETICNGKGINDTPNGWFGESDENKKIYYLWNGMIRRCYDKNYLEKRPTYKDVKVCDEWLKLSNFARDVKTLENYELWLKNDNYQLDKDILSDELNISKIYSKNTCKFVTLAENTRYANSKKDHSCISGENHPNYGKHLSEKTKEKIRKTKLGEKNPMFGKPMPNKDQLIKINKKKIIAKNLITNDIYKFDSITEACDYLSNKENKVYKGTNISKICKYNEDPIAYYNKFGKRCKQYKGYTYYYDKDGDK